MRSKKEIKQKLDELKDEWTNCSRLSQPTKRRRLNSKIDLLEWVLE